MAFIRFSRILRGREGKNPIFELSEKSTILQRSEVILKYVFDKRHLSVKSENQKQKLPLLL